VNQFSSLLADDASDRQLLAHVHPPDWVNPTAKPRYHLVVIGGGTAGLVAAAGAAGLGARVALIERELMGGDCLNIGCVPSKGVIRAARAWHAANSYETFGAPPSFGGGDFGVAMARMRRLRAKIGQVDGAPRFAGLGVDVFLGEGRFAGPSQVTVDGQTLTFRKALIATGGRAAIPPVPGLATAGYLTNETVFTLTTLPKRLAVIGGGPIGCELAQAFARFGSQVTLFQAQPQILPREDSDAAAVVAKAMARDGVRCELDVTLTQVTVVGQEKTIAFARGGSPAGTLTVDHILVAAGRRPNVEGLDLDRAGVAHGPAGVTVDDYLRTTNPNVFASGDVAGSYQFTHFADAQSRIVLQNAFFSPLPFLRKRASGLVVPWCTYTSPEIAHVGLYERDARARGLAVDTLTLPLHEVDRAFLDGEDEGFLRLQVAKGKDRILGATLVAEHAGDMLGELCLAVTAGVGLNTIAGTIHPYPTQGEVVKKAADAWRRTKLTPGVKRLFRGWFRLLG
jgi:pyruvate/2-oxoglutarate dehydrogenase complex dihydrolipoamide dehydrogenase (E3) component